MSDCARTDITAGIVFAFFFKHHNNLGVGRDNFVRQNLGSSCASGSRAVGIGKGCPKIAVKLSITSYKNYKAALTCQKPQNLGRHNYPKILNYQPSSMPSHNIQFAQSCQERRPYAQPKVLQEKKLAAHFVDELQEQV